MRLMASAHIYEYVRIYKGTRSVVYVYIYTCIYAYIYVCIRMAVLCAFFFLRGAPDSSTARGKRVMRLMSSAHIYEYVRIYKGARAVLCTYIYEYIRIYSYGRVVRLLLLPRGA